MPFETWLVLLIPMPLVLILSVISYGRSRRQKRR